MQISLLLKAAALLAMAWPQLVQAQQATAPAATTTAFTGFTLIDGSGSAPVANATMLVRDGRVVSAGAAQKVTVPAGARRVSLAGKVVIPGLINAHGHAGSPADLATYAAYGVTTVYSLGGEPASVFAARDAQRTAPPRMARVYLAGTVLTPTTTAEARAQVAQVAAQQVDVAKIRVDDNLGTAAKMTPEVYRAVIDAAHAKGLRVAAHMYYLADARDLLASGADYMAHSVRDMEVDNAFAQALVRAKVCYTPTLMREVSTFVYERTPPFFADSQFLAHANRQWMAMMNEPARQEATRTSSSAQRYKAQLPVAMRNLKKLSDAGVTIAMGTDTGPVGRFQGYFELMELEMMVDAGLTPAQALLSATRDAARCMQVDRDLGTLEPGKWADFVVLDASPLQRISNVRKQHGVYIGGVRLP
jgi:imidazolonepropionase-like amidohydrolase